jgi:hypothetical protein
MWKLALRTLPPPDLNDALALVGLPVAGLALWKVAPRAFWAGLALAGLTATGWGVWRARAR